MGLTKVFLGSSINNIYYSSAFNRLAIKMKNLLYCYNYSRELAKEAS